MAVKNIQRLSGTGPHTFAIAHTWNILDYVAGDLDGATLQSDTPGTKAPVNFPAGTSLVGVTATDIDSSGGETVYYDSTSTVSNCEKWTLIAANSQAGRPRMGLILGPHVGVG
jgi:hypothetical protein